MLDNAVSVDHTLLIIVKYLTTFSADVSRGINTPTAERWEGGSGFLWVGESDIVPRSYNCRLNKGAENLGVREKKSWQC